MLYAIGTLPERFQDSDSTLKRPVVRLSVLGPVANLVVRFPHAYSSLAKASSCTLTRPTVRLSVPNVESSDLYADCTLPVRLSELRQMQVDKAHVAVPNWVKGRFPDGTLKRTPIRLSVLARIWPYK